MLRSLFGRSVLERAKTIAIAGLAVLLVLFAWQLSADQVQSRQDIRDRQGASDVARRFAIALTTYDYAHPEVQLEQIAAISSPGLRNRISAAFADIGGARASSLGEITALDVVALNGGVAHVLVRTSQVVSGAYVMTGTTVTGLLDLALIRLGGGWIVSQYRWLVAPSNAP